MELNNGQPKQLLSWWVATLSKLPRVDRVHSMSLTFAHRDYPEHACEIRCTNVNSGCEYSKTWMNNDRGVSVLSCASFARCLVTVVAINLSHSWWRQASVRAPHGFLGPGCAAKCCFCVCDLTHAPPVDKLPYPFLHPEPILWYLIWYRFARQPVFEFNQTIIRSDLLNLLARVESVTDCLKASHCIAWDDMLICSVL